MRIKVLTLFPDMFPSVLDASILGRARSAGLLDVSCVDIRPYSKRKHKNADDEPYGGGAGMVMLAQPIIDCVRDQMGSDFRGKRVYLSARGKLLTQQKARALATEPELILLCGHYEGVDQRAIDAVMDEELTIGDYVLTGGELAAMVLIDCVARMIPGVLGCHESAEEESFSDGLLEYPQYTRPDSYEGMDVPPVLLNGNHAKIKAWRREQSLLWTAKTRPELLQNVSLSKEDRKILQIKTTVGSHEEPSGQGSLPWPEENSDKECLK